MIASRSQVMRRRRAVFWAAAWLGAIVMGPAMGQPRLLSNPPDLTLAPPPQSLLAPEAAPPTARPLARLGASTPRLGAPAPGVAQNHAGRERFYELAVRLTHGTLFDPTNNRDQSVMLRSYVDADKSGDPRPTFVAPLINATPGDTVRITLRNELDADPSCTAPTTSMDIPHCFNGTNLHSHGLWVSPAGNSDNVLLSINPGVSFQYEYNIPVDHPAGTFWYHPHRHGSTALQVASGMAGALIIHGDRKPTATANGDLDTLLTTAGPGGKPFTEHVLLFQQIQYACFDKDGKIKTKTQDGKPDGKVIAWICDKDDTGEIRGDYAAFQQQFGPPTWAQSARWTSINGIVLPTIQVAAGTVERMRLIHAGVRDTIKVQFRKKNPHPTLSDANLTKQDLPQFLDGVCDGEIVPYQVVAADGLTMDQTMTTDIVTLQPGYRFDILTIFPEPGDYCITEPAKIADASVAREDGPANLLGFVSVSGTAKVPAKDLTKVLVETLVRSAKANLPGVSDQVIRDLRNTDPKTNLPAPRLTRFVPHRTITDAEVRGVPEQHLVFFIGVPPGGPNKGVTQFMVGNSFDVVEQPLTPPGPKPYLVPAGAEQYDPARIDRQLTLGTAQTWELRGYSVSHPFHIHVNPFQIVAILDPDNNDVSLPGVTEKDGDNQFAGLSGAWKDTLFVKTPLNPGDLTNPPTGYYRFIIRTRYERYIGQFVLHCHILDHEDQGMMQNVQVGLGDGAGGVSHGHH